ncbi:hypothetical protein ASPWEDRAFT_48626 [Aspergillus wentii DTO 134E9]|uniref:Uncharacterized protein n=1 Tax=Aspergillus wentii DTO 134E9 TaxID=1073089 RepID=A0A1L9RU32_ASPWE|nr:uncharacterized protein ASPWEDRAFT_48626 [Aspergillus wentii DTO 134E9]KAI9934013.1 hypothetical protein MW887_005086 [Aspergillus wentii]OJJ38378.1 hypothetical protein ASPWEDRAFT_48626 [Aspergillus wentii DTO 134E9]
MLTPIRVRGRRKTKSNGRVLKRVPSGRKGGRPLMSRKTRWTSSQSKFEKRARVLLAKPTESSSRKLSNLERLPVELLEKIFLYSLDVNLPRSSLSLAVAVSSERVYRALILLSFWNDLPSEENRDSRGAISRILRPLDYHPLHDEERGSLQNMVLRCKWFTVHRLLNQLPDLINLTIQRHWNNAGFRMENVQQEALERFLTRQKYTRTFQGFDKDNKPCTLSIDPLVSITITRQELDQQETHRILNVKYFPDKLLRGEEGFDDDLLAYIETFRIASGFNRSDHLETNVTLSREALQQGIHMALIENNVKALESLLKIDEYVFRSQHSPSDNSPPYTLPAEHFRTAVRVARNRPEFLQLLLRTSAESLPADDSEVTEWAMYLNNAFGRWLLDLMLHLPPQIEAARANPREAAMFYLGRANGQVEMARRYLNDVLNVEELPSWMEETSFDVSSRWSDCKMT